MSDEYLLQPGEVFAGGKYEVVKFLARGGLSEIYLARNKFLGIEHTLKAAIPTEHLRKNVESSNAYEVSKILSPFERTKREAMITGKLNHPHLIKVQDMVELPRDSWGLLMEPIKEVATLGEIMKLIPLTRNTVDFIDQNTYEFDKEGELERIITLTSKHLGTISFGVSALNAETEFRKIKKLYEGYWRKVQAEGTEEGLSSLENSGLLKLFDPFFKILNERYISFFFQIEKTYLYLMEKRIIHKDGKKDNILVDQFDVAKITDMGLSSSLDEDDNIWASRRVRPPESYLNWTHQSADLWSLGCLAFEANYRSHPFSKTSDSEEIEDVSRDYSTIIEEAKDDEFIFPFSRYKFWCIVMNEIMDLFSNFKITEGQESLTRDILLRKNIEYDPTSWLNSHKIGSSKELLDAFRIGTYLNMNPRSRGRLDDYDVNYVFATDDFIKQSTEDNINGKPYTIWKPKKIE